MNLMSMEIIRHAAKLHNCVVLPLERVTCLTHDGILTEEEEELPDQELDDKCIFVIRLHEGDA